MESISPAERDAPRPRHKVWSMPFFLKACGCAVNFYGTIWGGTADKTERFWVPNKAKVATPELLMTLK